jgi:RNA polymerase sigma-70 factor (ECF subfamily)
MGIRLPMAESRGPGHDTERFVRLFAAGQCEVLRYILALVPNIDEAREILQETAVDLWKKFDQYDTECPFIPWACRFAFFRILKFREQESRRRKFLSLEAIEQLAAERLEENDYLEDRRRALATCLKQLSDSERLIVEQRYSRGIPLAQLSEVTGKNISTLYKMLERVRRRLFDCISRRLELGSLR